jgi:hypothetical protein
VRPYVPKGDRSYWVVSPNVRNREKTVAKWREASLLGRAAFIGFGPKEHVEDTKNQGPKFAGTIQGGIRPGDVILIARQHKHLPQVVGFGAVDGPYVRRLSGVKTPQQFGSARRLSPFVAFSGSPPKVSLKECLTSKMAVMKLHPEWKVRDERLCNWMDRKLQSSPPPPSRSRGRIHQRHPKLLPLPHSGELEYKVRTRHAILTAARRESNLVERYERWLKRQDRSLHIGQYGRLRCDAFEKARNNLIEAKSSAKRENIRMAVGQLLDYGFQAMKTFGRSTCAILLPEQPTEDVLDWLSSLRISVIWPSGDVFLDNANGQFI